MPGPVRVLELRSVRGTGGGPEKTLLLGAARTDPSRFAVTVCYLRDARDPQFSIDRMASSLSVDYVEIVERHSIDPWIWPALRRLVRERSVDIVHAHDYKTDLIALALARFAGVAPLATAHGWTGQSVRERAPRAERSGVPRGQRPGAFPRPASSRRCRSGSRRPGAGRQDR